MTASTFRLKSPITAVIRNGNGYRLKELAVGSVFYATGSQPDLNGMIDGTCNDEVALVYRRDLDERAEPILTEMPVH